MRFAIMAIGMGVAKPEITSIDPSWRARSTITRDASSICGRKASEDLLVNAAETSRLIRVCRGGSMSRNDSRMYWVHTGH
jgi:hypothetical protein